MSPQPPWSSTTVVLNQRGSPRHGRPGFGCEQRSWSAFARRGNGHSRPDAAVSRSGHGARTPVVSNALVALVCRSFVDDRPGCRRPHRYRAPGDPQPTSHSFWPTVLALSVSRTWFAKPKSRRIRRSTHWPAGSIAAFIPDDLLPVAVRRRPHPPQVGASGFSVMQVRRLAMGQCRPQPRACHARPSRQGLTGPLVSCQTAPARNRSGHAREGQLERDRYVAAMADHRSRRCSAWMTTVSVSSTPVPAPLSSLTPW